MRMMQGPPDTTTIIEGESYLYFGGTGYLGLHTHPEVIDAACQATRQWGTGSATSRAGWGTSPPVREVERLAAEFWQAEEAFYFPSGYLGNHLLLAAILEEGDALFIDENAHYSIGDACRLLGVPVVPFATCDPQALADALSLHLRAGQTPVVVSDGVFASRGTMAPVPEYLDILQAYEGSKLCLDDCHGVGVLGSGGRGSYEHHGLDLSTVNQWGVQTTSPALYAVGTLSKAFGGHGGILYGSVSLVDAARKSCHYFSGASAPTNAAAAASAKGLELAQQQPQLIANAQRNAKLLRQGLRDRGLAVEVTPVPFVGVSVGDDANMARLQRCLRQDGIYIAHLQGYAGLSASGVLRITVFATHTPAMIHRLLHSLSQYL